jgi:hypothetical protein
MQRVVEMKTLRNNARADQTRVAITAGDRKLLSEIHGTGAPSALARRTGLPYMGLYNLVHGRVNSLSARDYRILFRRPAPREQRLREDGAAFRAMVDLWRYLNGGPTKAELYRELLGLADDQRVDHRLFSGKVRSVDARLERRMRRKFSEAGVDGPLLERWLMEFEGISGEELVPYKRIRPVLQYLKETLGLQPNAVLHQSVARYESGALKRVSRSIYDQAVALQLKTKKALAADPRLGWEQLRESLFGGRPGFILFADIRDDLHFLRQHARKGAKRYLGRAIWTYEKGNAKRIAAWRARKVREDCDRVIRQRAATLRLADLPPARRKIRVRALTDLLTARATHLLSGQEGLDLEKRILRPSHARDEYDQDRYGFTPFDMAPGVLGMKRKAFDLMVAGNCDIFRSVGKYAKRWYLSDLYLREISQRKNFDLVSAKYEMMAKRLNRSGPAGACLH